MKNIELNNEKVTRAIEIWFKNLNEVSHIFAIDEIKNKKFNNIIVVVAIGIVYFSKIDQTPWRSTNLKNITYYTTKSMT